MQIRKTNLEVEEKDRKTYLQRWEDNKVIVNKKKIKNDRKQFLDATKTSCRFKKAELLYPQIIWYKTKKLIKRLIYVHK